MSLEVSASKPLAALLGIVLAIGAAVPLTAGLPGRAAAQQIDGPWQFTPRDRRVAIALAIKQVEDGLLGPSTSNDNVQNFICNGPSADASATSNFFCEITQGSGNTSGDKGQASAGNQTATNNNSTNGNVTQTPTSTSNAVVPPAASRVQGVAAALNGRF